ncbi:MAG: phosphate ABC transporter substrate-binding protein, partial [Actinobacteria bacterium]
MIRSRFLKLVTAAVVATTVLAVAVPQGAFAATEIKVAGSTTVQPLAQQWATAYKKVKPAVSVVVAGGGSSVGFTNVDKGIVDIGMSSRDPKAGFESGLTKFVVAKDAVAVVVNPGNTVRKLTAAQVKDIYTGKITNWKAVGGPNATIVLCGRTGASGTYEFFKEKFLLGSRQSARTKAYASNGMVRSAVARNKYAVGYVSIAYVNTSVRGVSINGVAPT